MQKKVKTMEDQKSQNVFTSLIILFINLFISSFICLFI